LGQSVETWLGAAQVARLQDALRVQRGLTRSLPMFEVILLKDGRMLDAFVHEGDGVTILEFERARATEGGDAGAAMRRLQSHLAGARTVAALLQGIADAVHAVTGFGRVMVYRFLPDGSGRVEAEARDAGVASFLGLHYPAADIPVQARALYLKNWLRLIPDVTYVPAPLQPLVHPATGRMLDLSQSVLRSVSPIHLEYLSNMGVAATMVISMVRHGQLWGMIACHHHQPHHVPARLRVACELFAEMASMMIDPKITAEDMSSRLAGRQKIEDLKRLLADQPDLSRALTQLRPNLLDLIPASGASLWFNGQLTTIGEGPTQKQIVDLVAWLGTREAAVFATDQLATLHPPAEAFAQLASGVLALSLSRVPSEYVLWFLPERVKTVTWGGDPSQKLVTGRHGNRLSPRGSFEAWVQEVRLQSRPWEPVEIEVATSLRTTLLEVFLRRSDLAAREAQNLLMTELDHRVKNVLATIQALANLSQTDGQTLEGFLATFEGRLQALSLTHNLLAKTHWGGVDLRTLIEQELSPYAGRHPVTTVIASGAPAVRLRAKAALGFSLGIHELATNAAKYGALSVPGGSVHLDWREEQRDMRMLVLHWVERGGPAVREPSQRGFGLTLIESSLSYELGGTVEFAFAPGGFTCTVALPWDQLVSIEEAPRVQAETPVSERPGLTGARILVVEDNALLARSVVKALQAFGVSVVGPAPRLAAAVELAESAEIEGALLDIDLDGTRVWPAADVLAARGVPFAFASGYQESLILPPGFHDRPVLNKPFSRQDLKEAMQRMLGGLEE
ncbi:MAG: GAF domain-containing protein, partial [Proteobacteria bacterium]|nr:GAF domain-containing protein [Pseudomonadota bacterium]